MPCTYPSLDQKLKIVTSTGHKIKCIGTNLVHVPRHSHRHWYINLGCQVALVTKYCMVPPRICGPQFGTSFM
jgi:hypothetical protein